MNKLIDNKINISETIRCSDTITKEMIKNLREIVPLHEGNQFEEGYHHALDQVEQYGKLVEALNNLPSGIDITTI